MPATTTSKAPLRAALRPAAAVRSVVTVAPGSPASSASSQAAASTGYPVSSRIRGALTAPFVGAYAPELERRGLVVQRLLGGAGELAGREGTLEAVDDLPLRSIANVQGSDSSRHLTSCGRKPFFAWLSL